MLPVLCQLVEKEHLFPLQVARLPEILTEVDPSPGTTINVHSGMLLSDTNIKELHFIHNDN
jgi:hypothetical protein